MNARRLKMLAEDAKRQDVYPSVLFPPSVYYRFLRKLAMFLKPQVSVELGVCGGGSSLHLAIGNPDGKVFGVDVANSWPENIEYVQEHCPNFEFWRMDSLEAATAYKEADLPPIGILFIDTIHTYDRTMIEFYVWQELLGPDAVVVLDDLYRDGMDRAWEELPGQKIRLDEMHIGGSPTDGGFGVLYNL